MEFKDIICKIPIVNEYMSHPLLKILWKVEYIYTQKYGKFYILKNFKKNGRHVKAEVGFGTDRFIFLQLNLEYYTLTYTQTRLSRNTINYYYN